VLLNGPSSSGKSTVAKELHTALPGSWLLLGIDTFLEMLPMHLRGAINPRSSDPRARGTWYDMPLSDDQVAQIEAIRPAVIAGEMTTTEALDSLGVAAQLAARGVQIRCGTDARRAIAALASAGNHLIVDHCLWERDWLTECAEALAPHSTLFVGIRCPVEVLAARERSRGDRCVGQAKSDAARVHWDGVYDIEIQTDECSPPAAAAMIAARVAAGGRPTALRTYSSDQRRDDSSRKSDV